MTDTLTTPEIGSFVVDGKITEAGQTFLSDITRRLNELAPLLAPTDESGETVNVLEELQTVQADLETLTETVSSKPQIVIVDGFTGINPIGESEYQYACVVFEGSFTLSGGATEFVGLTFADYSPTPLATISLPAKSPDVNITLSMSVWVTADMIAASGAIQLDQSYLSDQTLNSWRWIIYRYK